MVLQCFVSQCFVKVFFPLQICCLYIMVSHFVFMCFLCVCLRGSCVSYASLWLFLPCLFALSCSSWYDFIFSYLSCIIDTIVIHSPICILVRVKGDGFRQLRKWGRILGNWKKANHTQNVSYKSQFSKKDGLRQSMEENIVSQIAFW